MFEKKRDKEIEAYKGLLKARVSKLSLKKNDLLVVTFGERDNPSTIEQIKEGTEKLKGVLPPGKSFVGVPYWVKFYNCKLER